MKPLVLERMAGKEFTSDETHLIVEPPAHENWHGVLFAQLKKHLIKVGYRPSARKERNGGLVAVWRIAEPANDDKHTKEFDAAMKNIWGVNPFAGTV